MEFDISDSEGKVSSTHNYTLNPLSSLEISSDVKRRLKDYFNNFVIKGSNEPILSAIAENHGPSNLLAEWDAIYNSDKSRINSALDEIEMSNRSKFGPRSIAKPWSQRREGLLDYFDDNRPNALKSLEVSPPCRNLRPITRKNAISYLKSSTSSGLPYYVKKGSLKDKLTSMSDHDFYEGVAKFYPSILFTRTQEGNKTRDVWGYPIFLALLETMFYIPLLAVQRLLPWRKAITTPEEVDRAVSALLYKCIKDKDSVLVSIDFSSFDKSVLTSITRIAFDYIKGCFQSTFHDHIDLIFKYFTNGGIVTPDGIYSGRHGVPSGSTFTNEVDSIVQFIIAMSSGFVSKESTQIQGDDGLYLISMKHLDLFLKCFSDNGLIVNMDKSVFSREYCVYLQKLYHPDYVCDDGVIRGVYSTYRALGRICYQERFVDFLEDGLSGKDYYSLRTICILENCRNHPLYEELVKFVLKKDKYLLRFSETSVSKFKNLVLNTTGQGGVTFNQYGEDVAGISSFQTVRLLRKLA